MKKVRLFFVGTLLAIFCVGFTSCGHEVEDMDPINTENVENGTINIDVRGEDPEDENNPKTMVLVLVPGLEAE